MSLKIITLIKQVPLPTEMRMGADGLMDRTKAKSAINADCAFGLEQGLQIKKYVPDAELIVVSMGPASFEQSLKKALSLGYDRAILLSDRKLGGSDTFATGYAIASLLRKLGFSKDSKEPFIIFSGRQTTDGDTAHVPSQVAENLSIPQATFVEKINWQGDFLRVRRIIEGGFQILKIPVPCLISVSPTAMHLRRPSLSGAIRARNAGVEVWSLDKTGADSSVVGLSGSPTLVSKVMDIKRERPAVNMISGHTPKELIDKLIDEVEKAKSIKQAAEEVHTSGNFSEETKSVGVDFPRVDFRGSARGILTWIEMRGKTPARSSLEILNPARRLADELKTDVTAVVTGHNIKNVANDIIAYGADKVILVDDERLKEYRILPVTRVLEEWVAKQRPEIALFAATTSGRELAPRLASRIKAGVTADCTSLKIGEYVHRIKKSIFYPVLESIRPTYGESKLATILGFWCPQMATARAGTFKILPKNLSRKGTVQEFTPNFKNDDFVTELIEVKREESGSDNLFVADVIVSGGRPVGDQDNFKLIQEMLDALRAKGVNADWGASRHAVDQGYAPYARQIGQTGKTVRPKVYVAVSISGAIQHIAGMKEAEIVIAINRDPSAQIFQHADFGIVRDYREVLPELIERIRGGWTFGIL